MAAAKSSASRAVSTAVAAAAVAGARAVSASGWLARPVATAPVGTGPFFSSALRMLEARLKPASRLAPSSVARKAARASTRRTMRTRSSSPS